MFYILNRKIVLSVVNLKICRHFTDCFRMLPREVDPLVYNMSHEDPGNISYAQIGGLSEQIRELREVGNLYKAIGLYMFNVVCAARLVICRIALVS